MGLGLIESQRRSKVLLRGWKGSDLGFFRVEGLEGWRRGGFFSWPCVMTRRCS